MVIHTSYILIILSFMLIMGCSPESRYLGGAGSFKSYEGLDAYNSKSQKENYNNQSYSYSYQGFRNDLVSPDSFRSGEDSNSYMPSNNYVSQYDGESPVRGESGNFEKSDSLMRGMRESAAIQRATMRAYKVGGKMYYPTKVSIGETFDGVASWYGPDFHSKVTSNGETYNMYSHTAASKTLPMNTIVRVFNKENSKTTIVRINDRGPFVDGRIIDLSNVAARDIDMVGKGTANVRIEIIGFGGVVSANKQGSLTQSQHSKLSSEIKIGDSQNIQASYSFALVLNSFSKKQNAEFEKQQHEKLVQNTKYKLEILESNNIYRVALIGFKSEGEAQDFQYANRLKGQIIAR